MREAGAVGSSTMREVDADGGVAALAALHGWGAVLPGLALGASTFVYGESTPKREPRRQCQCQHARRSLDAPAGQGRTSSRGWLPRKVVSCCGLLLRLSHAGGWLLLQWACMSTHHGFSPFSLPSLSTRVVLEMLALIRLPP